MGSRGSDDPDEILRENHQMLTDFRGGRCAHCPLLHFCFKKDVEESKKMWRVAFPGILAGVTSFGLIVVTQSFIGHLNELDRAAYALVQILTVHFVNGILLGMSSATETLCGQAFGAGQPHMMGIYLQRSWIVDFATTTILLPVFIFTNPIFRALGEKSAIAVVVEDVALWFIPFCYSFVFILTMQMYLQAQLKNMVIAWLSSSSFLFHLLTEMQPSTRSL